MCLFLSFVTFFWIENLKYGHTTCITTLLYNFDCKNFFCKVTSGSCTIQNLKSVRTLIVKPFVRNYWHCRFSPKLLMFLQGVKVDNVTTFTHKLSLSPSLFAFAPVQCEWALSCTPDTALRTAFRWIAVTFSPALSSGWVSQINRRTSLDRKTSYRQDPWCVRYRIISEWHTC